MTRLALLLAAFALLHIILPATAQHHGQTYIPETDPLVLKKLDQWQDAKFGLLMHWGTYSQWGIVESWSICAEDEGWCRRSLDDYTEYKKRYEDLKKTFNPVKFDPQKWADAAHDAGMKYVVFTTKHHDGFCMFDTKLTDYRVTHSDCRFSSNPRANIAKEIFDAFRAKGFMTGAYFSKPDWHSENYWWPNFATPDRNVNYDIPIYPERWQKFVNFTHGQIDELMSQYGPMDILWLDGGWVQPMTREEIVRYINSPDYKFSRIQSQDINMPEMVRKAREKQPGLIVVDRAVPGKFQNYLTPENQVPDRMLPYPWESCIIMGGGWSYSPNATYRSAHDLIHLLVDIVSKGGNLLLNIGPGPDGTWQPDAYDRLRQIGDWMEVNGAAIYSTRPIAPYKEGKICLTQQRDGAVYAIYLADESETVPPTKIWLSTVTPTDDATVTFVGANTVLAWEKVGTGFLATIPEQIRKNAPCKYAWVFKISGVK